jgi:hypothetical protein
MTTPTRRVPTFPSEAMTAAEFAQIPPQPCPVCGTTVNVEQIYVTPNPMSLAEHGRIYIAGRWACPRTCDPETGQRYHAGYTRYYGDGPPRYVCSCGGEVHVHTQAECDQFLADHPVGQWR